MSFIEFPIHIANSVGRSGGITETNIISVSKHNLFKAHTLLSKPRLNVYPDENNATTHIIAKNIIESLVVMFILSSLNAIVLISPPYSVCKAVFVTNNFAVSDYTYTIVVPAYK